MKRFFKVEYTHWLSVRSLLPVVAEPCTPEAAAAAVDPESWCLRSLWTMPINFIHGLLAAWVPMPPLCHIALASLAPYTGARIGLRLVFESTYTSSRERPSTGTNVLLLRFVLSRRINFFRREFLVLRALYVPRDELGTYLALFRARLKDTNSATLRVFLGHRDDFYVLAGAHTAHLQLH